MKKKQIKQLLDIRRILKINTEIKQFTNYKTLKEFNDSFAPPCTNLVSNIIQDTDEEYINNIRKEQFYYQIKNKNINKEIIQDVKVFLVDYLVKNKATPKNINFLLTLVHKYNDFFTDSYRDTFQQSISDKYDSIYKENNITETLIYLNTMFALELEIALLFHKGASSHLLNSHLLLFNELTSTKLSEYFNSLEIYYQVCLMGLLFIYDFTSDDYVNILEKGIDSDTLSLAYNIFESAENYYSKKNNYSFEELFNYSVSNLANRLFSLKMKKSFNFNRNEMHLILNLYEKCKHYRYSISLDHIVYFLNQFSNKSIALSALKILNSELQFFRLNHLSELIECAFQKKQIKNFSFAIFGDHGGSSSIINYLIAHSTIDANDSHFIELDKAIKHKKTICFVDDCLLSGTQAIEILEAYSTKYNFTNISIVFLFAIAMDEGIDKLNNYLASKKYKNYDVLFGTKLIAHDRVLECSKNYLYENKTERSNLKKELKNIGKSILKDRAIEKEWSKNKRKQNALGYGDQQKILVFEYGVPKSTLVCLWETGTYNDKEWIPLFPHYKNI
ncbi:MAG: hypothetical protein WC667_11770 [Sulfurimonas sp.]|jgi:hypothetical protein